MLVATERTINETCDIIAEVPYIYEVIKLTPFPHAGDIYHVRIGEHADIFAHAAAYSHLPAGAVKMSSCVTESSLIAGSEADLLVVFLVTDG